jgi:hypothetical protein
MEDNDNDIINKIKKQKEEFNQWRNYLISNLTKGSYKKEFLYLVEEEWLRRYQNEILDVEIEDENKCKLIKNYKLFKDINNNKLMDIISEPKNKFQKFPKVSVLNINTWRSFQKENGKTNPIKSISLFCNKLLLITLLKSNYCFFFLDQNNILRQGYLKILNPIYEATINNQFLDKNINFILGYEKEIKNCKNIRDGKLVITNDELYIKIEKKFEILIFGYVKKKEEKLNNFTNIIKEMEEKEEKQKANIIVINPNLLKQINQINKNNNENNNKEINKNKSINDNSSIYNNSKIIDKNEENSKLLEQNEEYRKRINILEEKIKNLEIKLNEEKIKNENLNKRIDELETISNHHNETINTLELENEIKLFRSYYNFASNEKLISIKFISVNQDIDFPVIAKNTDKFIKIESLLYEQYPDYKNSENYFLVNGRKVNKYNSLKENNIGNNDILTLQISNFD